MRKTLATIVVGTLVLTGIGIAQATPTESLDFTIKLSHVDRKKGTAALTLRTAFKITDTGGGRPPALTNTTLRFPKGAAVNARYFKRCNPDRLTAKGVSGCPSASIIGKGKAQGDARPIVNDPIDAKITMFNGQPRNGNPTIIIYAVPEISSPITIVGELKRQPKSSNYGYVLSVDVPPIPTLPGQPNASVSFFDATTLDKTVRRRGRTIHYIQGPVICNGTFFLLDGSFSYDGGITNPVLERFTLRGGPRCP
jgi:hypothetical protein